MSFSTLSRYRLVPDIAAPNRSGRVVAGKDARPLPDVAGVLTHTVEAGDRLDQLAFTFYGQPLNYWRICDANPDFLSPLAMLGKESVATARFALAAPAEPPPWAALIATLTGTVGVREVTVLEDIELVRTPGSEVVTEQPVRAVLVTYHSGNLTERAIRDAITSTGFTPGVGEQLGQLGQQIAIPTAVRG